MIENKIIYSISREGNYNLLEDISRDWFLSRYHKLAFDGMLSAFLEHDKISDDSVYDHISRMVSSREVDQVKNIYKLAVSEHRIVGKGLIKEFKERYIDSCYKDLSNTLLSDSKSHREKEQAIYDIQVKLTKEGSESRFMDVFKLEKDYYDKLKSGELMGERQKGMILSNPNMIKMFGNKIYPEPYIIGAKDSFGKTRIMLNLFDELISQGHKGILYTFEDKKEKTIQKYISIRNGWSFSDVYNGKIDKSVIKNAEGKITINDTGFIDDRNYTIGELEIEVQRKVNMYGIKFIMIDFIQIMRRNSSDVTYELVNISNRFIEMCKKHGIAIIYLSQLNDDCIESDGRITPSRYNLKKCRDMSENSRFIYLIGGYKDGSEFEWICDKNDFGQFDRLFNVHLPSGKVMSVSDKL